jgi:hypothetical protein
VISLHISEERGSFVAGRTVFHCRIGGVVWCDDEEVEVEVAVSYQLDTRFSTLFCIRVAFCFIE